MKIVIIVAILAVVGGGGVFIYSSSQNSQQQNQNVSNQSAKSDFDKLQAEIASGAKLYDVRTKEEFDSGYFQNAVNIPLQDLQNAIYPDVPKDTQIYVYCRSGNRSEQAVSLLRANGFVNVTDLGGLADVETLGGKIIKN